MEHTNVCMPHACLPRHLLGRPHLASWMSHVTRETPWQGPESPSPNPSLVFLEPEGSPKRVGRLDRNRSLKWTLKSRAGDESPG